MKISRLHSTLLSFCVIKNAVVIPLFLNALMPALGILGLRYLLIINAVRFISAMCFISLIANLYFGELITLARLTQTLLICACFNFLCYSKKVRLNWDSLLMAIAILCFVELMFEVALGVGKGERDFFGYSLHRSLGIMGEPNYSALIYCIVAAYAFARGKRWLYALMVAMILFVAARMAFVVVATIPLVHAIAGLKVGKLLLNLFLLIIPAVFLILVYNSYSFLSFSDQLTMNEYTSTRYMIWKSYFNMFFENPFLGVGYFRGQDLMSAFYPEEFGIDDLTHYSHNLLLQILVEFGIVGFFLYTLFQYGIYKKLASRSQIYFVLYYALVMNLLFLNGLNDFIFWVVIMAIITGAFDSPVIGRPILDHFRRRNSIHENGYE